MSEAAITTAILKALNALPSTVAIKLHGGPYSTAGMPDILVVHEEQDEELSFWGQAYFLEVKLPGKKPTEIQERRMAQLRDAGAVCAVVHNVAEAMEVVG